MLVNWVPVGAPAGRGGRFSVWEPAEPAATSQPARAIVDLRFNGLCPVRAAWRDAISYPIAASWPLCEQKQGWRFSGDVLGCY